MFESLRAEVEGLDVPVDGAAIVALLEMRDRLDAKVSQALGAFDAARLWDLDGATSLTAWLRDRAQLTRRAAGRASAVARRLRALPATAAAWIDGQLRGAQVDAVVANVVDRTLARFALHEAELLQPPPPPAPPTRLARQAPPRRPPRDHHPQRPPPHQPTTQPRTNAPRGVAGVLACPRCDA